jgi:hypothetical protein
MWSRKADVPGFPRFSAVGFGLNGKGYVGTGNYSDPNTNSSTALQDFWGYDPATDTWTRQPDFAGGPRYQALGFGIGNRGYVGLGIKFNVSNPVQPYLADFWAFDPTVVPLATSSPALAREIELYPNPAHSTVRLQFPSRLAQQGMQLSVVNTLGQVVLQQTVLPRTSTTFQLALPLLAKGVYLVRLRTAEGVVAKRLLID